MVPVSDFWATMKKRLCLASLLKESNAKRCDKNKLVATESEQWLLAYLRQNCKTLF